MGKLIIPYVQTSSIKEFLKQAKVCQIKTLNWQTYNEYPDVSIAAAHDAANLYILFRVRETGFMAEITQTNGHVYKDSCVELFISPLSGSYYYNFEFNAIGTVLAEYGKDRSNRQKIDPALLSQITTEPSLGRQPVHSTENEISWQLLIKIPTGVFAYDSLTKFSGCSAKGNVYKCGDGTPNPHYLTLWPVATSKPDFHRPEFFGDIIFE